MEARNGFGGRELVDSHGQKGLERMRIRELAGFAVQAASRRS
jgi:hypothetical protein